MSTNLKKATKAQLIELAKEKGIELNEKMLKSAMIEAIKSCQKKEEILTGKKLVGKFISTKTEGSLCGCNPFQKGTIGKVQSFDEFDKDYLVSLCPDGCIAWLDWKDIQIIAKEKEAAAKEAYEKANKFMYATID